MIQGSNFTESFANVSGGDFIFCILHAHMIQTFGARVRSETNIQDSVLSSRDFTCCTSWDETPVSCLHNLGAIYTDGQSEQVSIDSSNFVNCSADGDSRVVSDGWAEASAMSTDDKDYDAYCSTGWCDGGIDL